MTKLTFIVLRIYLHTDYRYCQETVTGMAIHERRRPLRVGRNVQRGQETLRDGTQNLQTGESHGQCQASSEGSERTQKVRLCQVFRDDNGQPTCILTVVCVLAMPVDP